MRILKVPRRLSGFRLHPESLAASASGCAVASCGDAMEYEEYDGIKRQMLTILVASDALRTQR